MEERTAVLLERILLMSDLLADRVLADRPCCVLVDTIQDAAREIQLVQEDGDV
ncbi:hypothetical protein [Neobittarella massiliensis]|uniref:Uncharacterized protein n=2 Tax=Oscillospiraceae TaxID=216572 RepID=A0A8J6ILL3_9FIRM|nr:hypothetical protein [Neobittarella massiliensis]MBC3515924.1 hypothetical protein [Neobittarella massiliensis]SCJ42485.1 Uncharacterised protein [uncultured Anaerotruncus sp.]